VRTEGEPRTGEKRGEPKTGGWRVRDVSEQSKGWEERE